MQIFILTVALLLATSCMAVRNDTCPRNSEFNECGTPCRHTCTYKSDVCIKRCEIGCFCIKDYILRDNTTFVCIKEKDCPLILVE